MNFFRSVGKPLTYLFLAIKLSVAGWNVILDSKIYGRDEFTGQLDIIAYFHVHNLKIMEMKHLNLKHLNFDPEAVWAL